MRTDSHLDRRMTVVMATYNRAAEAVQTLHRLSHLPERPAIVAIDNGSTDGTADAIAREVPSVDVVRLRTNIGAAARNIGIRRARTPYVALCDDDTWWAAGSLSRAADVLDAYERIAVITARVLVGPDRMEDPTCTQMAHSPLRAAHPLPGPPILGFLAGASMIRRAPFLAVGGFERKLFLGGEEALVALDLAARGWTLTYVDSVIVHHYPSSCRDASRRRQLLIRNGLWVTWLRRPGRTAVRRTLRLIRSARRDRRLLHGVAQALAGVPWVLRHRRVVPSHLEAALHLLEESAEESRRPASYG